MQTLHFSVTQQHLIWLNPCRFPVEGSRGEVAVTFDLDDEWEGRGVTVLFSNSFRQRPPVALLWTGEPLTVPEEVLIPGLLRIGLVGSADEGQRILPTVWMDKGIPVRRSGGTSGIAPEEADPALWEQVMAALGTLGELQTQDRSSVVAAVNEVLRTGGGGAVDPAEVERIVEDYLAANLTAESDPTVPTWAKQPEKPAYTAGEVGADPAGTAASAIAAHNVNTAAHSDIRLELAQVSARLTAFFDSDDQTLDELSEIVAYITSNKSLIDAVTTSKVSVADIVDNLTTHVANRPLSAAQGVVLKGLIDTLTASLADCQPKGDYPLRSELPTTLPNPAALAFTGAVTGSYDGSEPVSVEIPSGGGDDNWELINTVTIADEETTYIEITADSNGNPFALKKWYALFDGMKPATTYFCARMNDLSWLQQFSTTALDNNNVALNNYLRLYFEILSPGFYLFTSSAHNNVLRRDGEHGTSGGIQSNISAVNKIRFNHGHGGEITNGTVVTLWGVKA